jgi:hypothetical protein
MPGGINHLGASFGPGHSAEPEPVVSALSGECPSRKKNNRACGSRFELEVVKFLCAGGLDARKRFMSGQLDGEADIDLHQRWGELWPLECKWKKVLPEWLVKAIGKNKAAVIKESRGEPFVILRLSDFRDLCQ